MAASDSPWIATEPITIDGVMGYAEGAEVSAQVVRDNPEDTKGKVARPGTKAAEKAADTSGG